MQTIRESILEAMELEGLSANALALLVSKHVSRSQVYAFISGEHDLTTEKANHLLAALGLKIVAE